MGKIVRFTIDPNKPGFPCGQVNYEKLDATTEEDIARHIREDEAEALRDAGRFVRRVRRRLKMSQTEFACYINVSPGLLRKWEQGKQGPKGPIWPLLKILDKAPDVALQVLGW